MNRKIILFLIAILLIVFLFAFIPKLHPGGNMPIGNSTIQTNFEERATIAADLYGKNITECEYIKNVFPEMYNSTVGCNGSTKMMNWPDLNRS